jgi:CMP-N,N'-diacetyllegionaminic acid synthase
MINNKKVLAIVPARGGSKGLPRKNILDVGGKPMLAWSLEAAAGSSYIDRCIVSTDDVEIADVSRTHQGEVPFMRPAKHADDRATLLDVTLHALEQLPGYDFVVVLQPTSPLRSTEDIDRTLVTMVQNGAPSAVSVSEPANSPYRAFRTDAHGRLVSLTDSRMASKQQEQLPQAFVLNDAVYAARTDSLRAHRRFVTCDTVAHIMPAERSLAVRSAFDLKLVAFYLHESQHAGRNLAANA